MRTSKPKQGAVVCFFIDGLFRLGLVLSWFKPALDNLVDYCRYLLLHDKKLHCPICLALYVVKNGHQKRLFGSPVQNYICRNCGRQFCDNIFHRFYRYKYPVYAILLALDLKKQGKAITQIVELIFVPLVSFFFQPCYATITRWLRVFGSTAIDRTQLIKLKSGRRKHWEIDEQYDSRIIDTKEKSKYVYNGKKKAGTFGVIDPHTKLICLQSFGHGLSKIAKSKLQKTIYRWNSTPNSVWRDGWNGYDIILEELDIPYKTVIHSKEWVSKEGAHDNNMEREWVEKRAWIRPCRGFATSDGRSFYDQYYEMVRNFFIPRRALKGMTPAQKAGLKQNISWLALMSN